MNDLELWSIPSVMLLLIGLAWWKVVLPTHALCAGHRRSARLIGIAHIRGIVAVPVILGLYYLAATAYGLSAIAWMLDDLALPGAIVSVYLLFSQMIGIWMVARTPVKATC